MPANKKDSKTVVSKPSLLKTPEEFSALSRRVLRFATKGLIRSEFLSEVSRMIFDFSGCDLIEIRFRERERNYRSLAVKGNPLEFQLDIFPDEKNAAANDRSDPRAESRLESLYRGILEGTFDLSVPGFSPHGSFFTGEAGMPLRFRPTMHSGEHWREFIIGGEYRSLALIPFLRETKNDSLFIIKSHKADFFNDECILQYEDLAYNLGVALVHRHIQAALRERLKELTCLYGIAKIMSRPEVPLEEILQNTAELLPPAWRYPEITRACITFDGQLFKTPGFIDIPRKLSAPIKVNGIHRGAVEVIYLEERPPLEEGCFLKEERSLIDTVAGEIALVIERRQIEEDKLRLQEQLRHADRLATIGQLAAGVAHELNEPLGGILGFAQLAVKSPDLPGGVNQDLKKIVNASLHAREVIKKLLVFARQMPPRKTEVNFNRVIDEGLYFLESRCEKAGIKLIKRLSPKLPEIIADPTQLHQVLVNLVVNSIQAMPLGGKLILETKAINENIVLVVEDTGMGMSPEILKKIFIPFFTTKDVNEGTGLGLPVVHGIVTAHGGTIRVQSSEGMGTRFEVSLPVTRPESGKENEENG